MERKRGKRKGVLKRRKEGKIKEREGREEVRHQFEKVVVAVVMMMMMIRGKEERKKGEKKGRKDVQSKM